MTDQPAFDLDNTLPAWEANYEPGNVSDYLIGYANSEAAAKGAAIAWVQSQSDKDPASLEWVEMPVGDQHDHWYSLVQDAGDGMALDIGVNVRHRLPAGVRDAARQAAGQPAAAECTPCGSRSLPTYSGEVVRCVLDAGHAKQCQSAAEYPYVSWPNPSNGVWNPAVEQPAEAHPPQHRWAAELHDPLADEWVPGTRYPDRERAVAHLAHARSIGPRWKDGTPVERRLVRETTTWTVEETP